MTTARLLGGPHDGQVINVTGETFDFPVMPGMDYRQQATDPLPTMETDRYIKEGPGLFIHEDIMDATERQVQTTWMTGEARVRSGISINEELIWSWRKRLSVLYFPVDGTGVVHWRADAFDWFALVSMRVMK